MKCPKCWESRLSLVQAEMVYYHYDIKDDGRVDIGFDPESFVEESDYIEEEFVYCNNCHTKFVAVNDEGVCVKVNGTSIDYREMG